MADKCLPTLFVGDKDAFNRPFCGGEGWVGLVGLLVSGGLLAAEFHGVSSQTESIKTTRKRASCASEEERA